jgi:hypothetical protein
VFGLLLFLAPWLSSVYSVLDLPNPSPEIYTQLCGGLLIVCSYLLWIATICIDLAYPVGLSIGLINLAGVVLITGWIISGSLDISGLGITILSIASFILLIFGVIELRFALKRE